MMSNEYIDRLYKKNTKEEYLKNVEEVENWGWEYEKRYISGWSGKKDTWDSTLFELNEFHLLWIPPKAFKVFFKTLREADNSWSEEL